jgi:hypothetical protein
VHRFLLSSAAAAIASAGLLLSAAAQATTIVASIDDPEPGAPYTFSFYVSGYDFDVNHGFSIYFDRSLYSLLDSATAPGVGDWDLILLQPDAELPADGVFDALAEVDDPSTGGAFQVQAYFTGMGDPDLHLPFEVYQLPGGEAGPADIVETGITIPEPSTLALLAFSIAGLAAARRRGPAERRTRSAPETG